MKKYNQLNLGLRYQIECLLELGYNKTEIANQIGCHKSTIGRELKRNTEQKGCNHKQAQHEPIGKVLQINVYLFTQGARY